MNTFFPLPAFGWIFLATLLGMLIPASYIDSRRLVIPKWISLTTLGLGVAFNLARGAWLGARGLPVWRLADPGVGAGLLDGLMFSLAGFAVGFALFFLLWAMGTCGGGDVKLFAALGAWVGPMLAVAVLAGSAVVVAAIIVGSTAWRLASFPARPLAVITDAQKARRRLVSFSTPVTIATAAVLAWSFGGELGMAPADASPPASISQHPTP